jgi:putative membrane protein
MIRFAVRVVILAVIIGAVAKLVSGIHVYGGFGWLLWIALIFAIINSVLGPVFRILSLPLIILTLGLFLLVVNAALLGITAALSSHLDVDGFGSAVLGGFLIAVFSWSAEMIFPTKRRNIEKRKRQKEAAEWFE